MERKGIIMVYTGNGKGKTTAACGMVLRAAGHGHKVAFVQFLKGQPTGEVEAMRRFLPDVQVYRYGRDVFVDQNNPEPEDEELARDGFRQALDLLQSDLDLLVLDEMNVAIDYGLVSAEKLAGALTQRKTKMTVILTGRGLSPQIEGMADMISEVSEIRHHWRKGIPAQVGIEE